MLHSEYAHINQCIFLGFMAVEDITGLGLAEAWLKKLEDLNLYFQNCRGQGYDNGVNMKGCNCDV